MMNKINKNLILITSNSFGVNITVHRNFSSSNSITYYNKLNYKGLDSNTQNKYNLVLQKLVKKDINNKFNIVLKDSYRGYTSTFKIDLDYDLKPDIILSGLKQFQLIELG